MKWEDEEVVMEVVVSELVAVLSEAEEGEEEETGGEVSVVGQPSSDQEGQ